MPAVLGFSRLGSVQIDESTWISKIEGVQGWRIFAYPWEREVNYQVAFWRVDGGSNGVNITKVNSTRTANVPPMNSIPSAQGGRPSVTTRWR